MKFKKYTSLKACTVVPSYHTEGSDIMVLFMFEGGKGEPHDKEM